jgi:phenylpropionate dioxygenase-like ring-hydroxylating dioxygenase large terminal subunit
MGRSKTQLSVFCILLKCTGLAVAFHAGKSIRRISFRALYQQATSTPSTPAFDWEHQWYPVAPVRDLETKRPNKVTLLGRDFCVWSSSEGWNAFADVCPHRLVPLSEGRIENNLLQCAYHGWEFNTTGSCVKIPQLGSESQGAAAVSSSRACAQSFPVRIEQELLWIFPSTNTELSVVRQPALIDELDDTRNLDAADLYTRDLPYAWETLVENLCDPSHVTFAHHSIMNGADRYKEDQS